ncbi:MAG: excinuclease subunit [Thermomicrobiales bacterium]|jgi:excinuclease ABC subunit A|nr:excinuclease subunit [Thermomicrobiales bacterium]
MPLLHDKITVRGAREHNLKNIDVEIPRDRLVVLTGLSGSGKSSLAFDTIFAEGQRRYVESLSAYARQFLGQMEKPDVDHIDGLSPAISIDQKGTSRNPRSTVGTVTEVYDYLRLLFARIGRPHCPSCGRPIAQQSVQQMAGQILALPDGTRLMILAPVIRDRKGEHQGVFDEIRRQGFVRVRVDGEVRDVDETIELAKTKKHTIEVVVDRIVIRHETDVAPDDHPDRVRIIDSLEVALRIAGGMAVGQIVDGGELLFSENFACPFCGLSFGEIEPRNFSFNSPHGACPECTGLGTKLEFDPELIVTNGNLSIAEGALIPWVRNSGEGYAWHTAQLEALAEKYGFSLKVPFRDLPEDVVNRVLYGNKQDKIVVKYRSGNGRLKNYDVMYEGVIPNLKRRLDQTSSDYIREELGRYMSARPCPTCKGTRLKPEILSVLINGRNIVDLTQLPIQQAQSWFNELAADPEVQATAPLTPREFLIARQILKEIRERLGFLVDVGLDYLTLDRSANTLSGGEAQRIRLATQIGSSLMGVLYILDEPSIGLHQRDNARLIRTLLRLRDLGNTLIVVEHDEEMMRAADWIIDVGPGAGVHGGRIVAQGRLPDLARVPESITGQYLSGQRQIATPMTRRTGNGKKLVLRGARENNLKNVTATFPLGTFIAVTGVSGSGKSSLITDTLYRRLAMEFHNAREKPGSHDAIEGIKNLDKVIDIDQSPIGRTPRSNPATYTGLFTPIRELFASMPEAKARGYQPGRFSFNVKGGRCEACHGEGIIQIEMNFLPDVFVPCEVCHGKRYNREALEITYKGKSIADVLDMTVTEALAFFENIPSVRRKLQTLQDVGLGYIHLGQPATQLSGGEAQRVKLASELSRTATGRTLYILDEPTTGLHFADIEKLLAVLQRLTDGGNTIIVIEHNLDVIKSADWVIDLGPEGGNGGGAIIAEGTPEDISANPASFTGQYLRPVLDHTSLAAD